MKKFVSIVMVLVLLYSVSFAEEIDWANMSDDAIQSIIDAGRNELIKRQPVFGEKVMLIDQDGLQVYLTGKYDYLDYGEDSQYFQLEVVYINDSDTRQAISIDDVYVNGWSIYGGVLSAIDPGKKVKDTLGFDVTDAEITAYEDIQEIQLSFHSYSDETYDTLSVFGPVTVQFNAQ